MVARYPAGAQIVSVHLRTPTEMSGGLSTFHCFQITRRLFSVASLLLHGWYRTDPWRALLRWMCSGAILRRLYIHVLRKRNDKCCATFAVRGQRVSPDLIS